MGTNDKLSEVIAGSRVLRFHQLDAASEAANAHWRTYLARNVGSSQTLTEMQGVIRGFENSAPRVLMSKCIDGRVHGSDREGYPPTTITFFRTDGNRVMLSPENVYFWNRLNGVILAARRQTPGCPALFIAYGHFATLGRGCAAHAENKEAAMAAVIHQAQGLRERFEPEDLYVLHGMTNTDDGAETLVFPDGRSLDAAGLIDQPAGGSPRLESPCDVFQGGFLDRPFDDPETDRIVGGVHPRILLESGSMFEDLRLRLATEAYLLRAVTRSMRDRRHAIAVVAPALFESIRSTLHSVRPLPEKLQAPLAYQVIWNIAATLREHRFLATLSRTERERHVQHSEYKVCYGEGFEIEPRNRLILAKPGRGDDQKALEVAKAVLGRNRSERPQPHPPLVHVNVELAGDVDDWDAFDTDVLAPLETRIINVRDVFGDDCRVLSTFSRRREKCFYPVEMSLLQRKLGGDEELLSFPMDVTRGLGDRDFTRRQLAHREQAYRAMMLMPVDRSLAAASDGVSAVGGPVGPKST